MLKIDPDSTNSLRMLCSLKRSLLVLHDDDDENDKLQMIKETKPYSLHTNVYSKSLETDYSTKSAVASSTS